MFKVSSESQLATGNVPVVLKPMRGNRVPTIEENLKQWDQDYDWRFAGEPWSRAWGSSGAEWYGCIYPRIRRFLPASAILEIAPGFGRWTEFLLGHCDTLIGIDLTPKCIDGCRQRFAGRLGASFETNDGHSMPMVSDSSIDFAFSFDSLVHVEAETLKGYLTELARVLRPDGVAFLHHSNLGAYQRSNRALAPFQGAFKRIEHTRLRTGLVRIGVDRVLPWRAPSVSAALLAELCEKAGMRCVGQELVNWSGGVLLLDSISVLTRPGSRWDRPNRVVNNRLFRSEARSIRLSDSLYDPSLPPVA
jgi:SAM-dependent methyltransferase